MCFETLLNAPVKNEEDYFAWVHAFYDEWMNRAHNNYPSFHQLQQRVTNLVYDASPQFFVGKIDAKVALISLNPHADVANPGSEINNMPYIKTWKDYRDFFTNFMSRRYTDPALQLPNGRLSAFDRKLHVFLSGNNRVTAEDLARWNIFHVELCPVASSDFSIRTIDEYLAKYLLRTLEAISLRERSLILAVNNKVGAVLMKMNRHNLLTVRSDEFDYTISGGRPHVRSVKYTVTLPSKKVLELIAAPSFAIQGISAQSLIDYRKAIFTELQLNAINNALGI